MRENSKNYFLSSRKFKTFGIFSLDLLEFRSTNGLWTPKSVIDKKLLLNHFSCHHVGKP